MLLNGARAKRNGTDQRDRRRAFWTVRHIVRETAKVVIIQPCCTREVPNISNLVASKRHEDEAVATDAKACSKCVPGRTVGQEANENVVRSEDAQRRDHDFDLD